MSNIRDMYHINPRRRYQEKIAKVPFSHLFAYFLMPISKKKTDPLQANTLFQIFRMKKI